MTQTITSLKKAIMLVCLIISITGCKNSPAPDLIDLQFNERADQFLKGVAANQESRNNNTIRYDIKDVKQLTFQGLLMDSYLKIGAQNGIVSYYSGETNETATTNALLAAMEKKFGQPTIKIRDEKDDKAFYWITPTIYARYMRGAVSHNGHNGLSAFIEVASVKALNSGASPGMLDNYNTVKNWNNPAAQKAREGAVTNGPAPPGKSFQHTIKPN